MALSKICYFLVIMKIKSAIKNLITTVTSPHSDLDYSLLNPLKHVSKNNIIIKQIILENRK